MGHHARREQDSVGFLGRADGLRQIDDTRRRAEELTVVDGNDDGAVDIADYTIWADHYGEYKKEYGDNEERIRRKLERERFILPYVEFKDEKTGEVTDRFLADFHALYERRKAAKGRTPYAPEDRFAYTGEMLTSQHVEAKGDMAGIRFGSDNVNKAIANDARRPFIGFTSAELDLAVAEAVKHMERETR